MKFLNSQKGIAVIIVILVLAAILAGVGSVYYFKQQQAKKASILQIPPMTAPSVDWKTYTNDELGFAFKYPSNYTVKGTAYSSGAPASSGALIYVPKNSFILRLDFWITKTNFELMSSSPRFRKMSEFPVGSEDAGPIILTDVSGKLLQTRAGTYVTAQCEYSTIQNGKGVLTPDKVKVCNQIIATVEIK